MAKAINVILSPKISLILMCIISAAYICNPNLITKVLFIIVVSIVSVLTIIRYIIIEGTKLILSILETVGSLLFGCYYIFLYFKFTEVGTINIVFILCSILLLLPIIFEIGLSKNN